MHRYTIAKRLGDGTYGEVVRAVNNQSGEVVAVKRMKRKYYSWDDCIALREVQSLRKLRHPNIVKLKEIIRENDRLHMVFEHMDCNLYELTKNRRKHLPQERIQNHMYQILQGLYYMHKNGYFHRDMKPENILVLNNDITKIADFGLAKEVHAKRPYANTHTHTHTHTHPHTHLPIHPQTHTHRRTSRGPTEITCPRPTHTHPHPHPPTHTGERQGPLHRVHLYALVPRARSSPAVTLLQRACRRVCRGVHHGRVVHAAALVPRQ